MLTIRKILQMPIFQQATVVAGETGLDTVIRWVHIVSMPESNGYEWTKGGELILTVGFGLRENLEKQTTIIEQLVEHNIIGIVLSTGHYFDTTPQVMIDAANRLGFPIIELPGDIPFVEVTEAIFSRIVNEQYSNLQRAQSIHKTLTDIVLNGGTLQDLAQALADLLDKSITIESAAFEMLADAQKYPVDAARRNTIEAKRTSPEIIQQLQNVSMVDRLVRYKHPIYIEPDPEIGLEMARIVAPIVVARTILGYIWIIADQDAFSDIDTLAVEQAATVSALLVYKEKAVQESHRAMRGDFFSILMQADQYTRAQLEDRAAAFDFRLNLKYQVLIIEDEDPLQSIEGLPEHIESALYDQGTALVVVREQRVVVVLQAHHQPEGARIAHHLLETLEMLRPQLLIGVGEATDHINGLATSYEQAREVLNTARATGKHQGVFEFSDLGLLHWVLQVPDAALQANVYYRAISELDDYDSNQNKQLLETLENFLEQGSSTKEAAEKLFVHRNTLTYRLERIAQMTGFDLRDSTTQINLYVALKAYRLRN